MPKQSKPVILVTGSSGRIGSAIVRRLRSKYRIAGIDRDEDDGDHRWIEADLTSGSSIELALRKFRDEFGNRIASVIHLAAYFDFTGERNPLYRKLNVDGTRLLLEHLQSFEVEQFVYAGTMLVHEPCRPGERIDENAPIAPKWAYPESKAAAEQVIRESRGDIPVVLLHLAGLYDNRTAVPTLSHQIARIFERGPKGHFYAGDLNVGQSLIHIEDMADLVERTVDRRADLPEEIVLMAGEPDAMGYEALQDEIGRLIHGEDDWTTISVPKPVARAGSWLETKSEPIVPDDFDQGETPFIKPFMIDMADDHYALDISRVEKHLDWRPQHDIRDGLKSIVAALKDDPAAWYRDNGITMPDWVGTAAEKKRNADRLRRTWRETYRERHYAGLWTHFANMALGVWLLTSPAILGYESGPLVYSDRVSGLLAVLFGFLSLNPRLGWARWATAATGLWVTAAPLVFWAPTAGAYLNGTLVGALIAFFAVMLPPAPGIDPVAASTGPDTPEGWDTSPSDWSQRLPIILLAFVGFFISRYLAAYQLGHIDNLWDPFFSGTLAEKNGTEQITTSRVSEAWPVPDAGLGALTYLLEILSGVIGSVRRWRTMPWLVLLFGFLIVPLGIVSITFIIIQPILIGTWCTLCLVAAAAMLIQIPYSLDELLATAQFLWRRHKAGRPLLRILLRGDTEDGATKAEKTDFDRPLRLLARDMWASGITLPWNLTACLAIGILLLFTRPLMGADGGMANAHHLIGCIVVSVTVIAFAEIGRPLRFLNMPSGVALFVAPFAYGADWPVVAATMLAGVALIVLSMRRGPVTGMYGSWQKFIV